MDLTSYKPCPVHDILSISTLYSFFKHTYSKNYTFKGERHDFIEVVCVASGSVGITADKNVYLLNEGQMIVHPAREFHAIWSDCGTEPTIYVFSFRDAAFPSLAKFVYSLTPERLAELGEIYEESKSAFVLGDVAVESILPGMETKACAIVKRLELFLLQIFSEHDMSEADFTSRSAEKYKRILSVMEEHLNEPLTAAHLAEMCLMSVPTLEKTVYRYSRCGAMAYYSKMKMQRAEQMLMKGASVKETALSLGFSNQNYFSACFKKWAGFSPSQIEKHQ